MKYFFRILAFLFIGFTSLYCYTLEEALEIANQKISSAIASAKESILFSNLGCSSKGCFIKIDNTFYSVHSETDNCTFETGDHYVCYSDKYEEIHYVRNYYSLYGGDTSFDAMTTINPNICDDVPSNLKCQIVGTAPAYKTSFKASPVCSLKEGEYFSAIIGKCVPKCVNPENGEQGYYNDEKGRCEFCSFGATFDEETETCSNWKCFELENKMERFDCLCREGGHGAGVSVKTFVTGAGTDCSITCEDGLRISTISNFNVFKSLFDTVFNGGYIQTTFNNPTQFCTVDNSTNIDLVDSSDSEAKQSGSQSSEQSSEQAGSKSAEQSGKQSSEQAGSQSSEKAVEKAGEQAGEQAGSQSGEQGGVSKGTISIKDPVTGKEEVVEIGKNKKENSIIYRDPETGNQVEIKPKDKTGGNAITITDTITGEKKTVEIGKNDNKKNEISYKDPYTGKDVVIDLTPKGKRDDSQGEAKGQGKVDKKGEGDFEFKGPNLGGLGNPEDFDKGLELLGLSNKLSNLENEGEGIFNGLLNDSKVIIADAKASLDGIVDTAKQLSKNPITYNSVSSCPIGFSLLNQQHTIDLCKVLSRFDHLFYALFFVILNFAVFFVALRIMMLAIVGFTNL
ncbi:MAG: hypothetical protein MSS71_02740 [Campylobacter sp.]|uniref:hypothetical protein n=1 Tax=Campylobacter sp. TaxID=205 RepID=UPI002AA89615|nr:hypothetical protein [Campylobacter sp.]MCI7586763.1 hypothetical protein [Campylobacter sp.]